MKITEYSQIFDQLFQENLSDYVYEGQTFSEACPGMKDGILIDNIFSFITPPIASDRADGSVQILRMNSEEGLLADVGQIPEVSFSFLPDCGWDHESKELDMYETLYPALRSFAFSDDPTDEELELLEKFMASFMAITNAELREVYQKVSPEFFQWVTDIRKKALLIRRQKT